MFDLVKFLKSYDAKLKVVTKQNVQFSSKNLKFLGKFYKDVTCKNTHRICYKKSSASHENLGHDEFVICF